MYLWTHTSSQTPEPNNGTRSPACFRDSGIWRHSPEVLQAAGSSHRGRGLSIPWAVERAFSSGSVVGSPRGGHDPVCKRGGNPWACSWPGTSNP